MQKVCGVAKGCKFLVLFCFAGVSGKAEWFLQSAGMRGRRSGNGCVECGWRRVLEGGNENATNP